MAVFPVRLWGDPVLRQRAAEVPEVEDSVRKLMQDLFDTMRDAAGVGLAAPQIGVLRRVIVWEYEGERGALANPRIVDRRGEVEAEEGCLSLPGLSYPVVRAHWIRVVGLDREGADVSIEAADLIARIIQHEVDHADGILFIDHLAADLAREAKRRLREAALTGSFAPSTAPRL